MVPRFDSTTEEGTSAALRSPGPAAMRRIAERVVRPAARAFPGQARRASASASARRRPGGVSEGAAK
jgi:hypothetical protein